MASLSSLVSLVLAIVLAFILASRMQLLEHKADETKPITFTVLNHPAMVDFERSAVSFDDFLNSIGKEVE